MARVVVGARDPNPRDGRGIERLRDAGVEVELAGRPARAPPERGLADWTLGRPFVTYKVAATLDGRWPFPGALDHRRGESRRRVHELRAGSTRSRSAWAPCAPTGRG